MGKSKTSGNVNTNMGYTTLLAGTVLRDGTRITTNTYVTFLQTADGTKTIQTPLIYNGKQI